MISSSDLIAGILTLVTGPAFASATTGDSPKPSMMDQDKYEASPVEPSLWDLPRADRNLACERSRVSDLLPLKANSSKRGKLNEGERT
jgi:hypothetical protein